LIHLKIIFQTLFPFSKLKKQKKQTATRAATPGAFQRHVLFVLSSAIVFCLPVVFINSRKVLSLRDEKINIIFWDRMSVSLWNLFFFVMPHGETIPHEGK